MSSQGFAVYMSTLLCATLSHVFSSNGNLFKSYLQLQTFAIRDVDEQKEQINGICVLFCIVAVTSFFSQFLQVGIFLL